MNEDKGKTILGNAAMLLLTIEHAVRSVGTKAPDALAKLEAGLASGEITLTASVQRNGGMISVQVAAIEGGMQQHFDAPLLCIQGPAVESLAEFNRLMVIEEGARH